MRIQKLLYLLAAVFIEEIALAKMPFTNEVFGKVEGTLDHCARVDSPAAEKYQQKKKDLVKGIPEGEVDQARNSEDYKSGYDWTNEELHKMSKDDVSAVCAAALENKK